MFTHKLTISYIGTRYHGWQWQDNALSVQQVLTEAIETVLRHKISLHGSGRTDAGVHALGQTAHFQTEEEQDYYRFVYAVNSLLPDDVAILSAETVPDGFHSRFDAKSRVYRYILNQKKNPFIQGRSWFYPFDIDIAELQEQSRLLLGKHDFSPFCKEMPSNGNTECEIKQVNWRKSGSTVMFQIEGDRFLHSMVRLILGALLGNQKDRITADSFETLAYGENRHKYRVPAEGLYLYKVLY